MCSRAWALDALSGMLITGQPHDLSPLPGSPYSDVPMPTSPNLHLPPDSPCPAVMFSPFFSAISLGITGVDMVLKTLRLDEVAQGEGVA